MGFFDSFGDKLLNKAATGGALDPRWSRDDRGRFHRLLNMDVEKVKIGSGGGVVVVWHQGVHPRWINVIPTGSLDKTVNDMVRSSEVKSYEVNGGVYITWSPIDAKFRYGVVHYLRSTMKPLIALSKGEEVEVAKARQVPVLYPT